MAYRNRPRVSLALLLLGALACAEERSRIAIGRLDVSFHPDSTAASSRPLRGSLLLRDLESGAHELVPIDGDTYQRRSAWLDPGSYLLEWQPALDLADALDSYAFATERRVVTVADGQVTTVNVRTTLRVSSMRDAIAEVVAQ